MSSILKKAAVVSIPTVRQALLRSNPVLATSLLAKRAYNSKNGVEVYTFSHPQFSLFRASLFLSVSYTPHLHVLTNDCNHDNGNQRAALSNKKKKKHTSILSPFSPLGTFIFPL